MNIQIYGKSKCFDTKKEERWFKERGIKYQLIDLPRYGMSAGEYRSVCRAVGGREALMDTKSKAYAEAYLAYLTPEQAEEKLLATPAAFRTPIVRNGGKATVGYCPEVWSTWE